MKQSGQLKVAVISKSNADGGGASRVAEDLACMLNEQPNVMAHHWLAHPGQEWRDHMRLLHGGHRMRQLIGAFRRASGKIGLPDYLTPELFVLWRRKPVDYDIYHFHDTSSAVSPITMRWLARRRPVVWTLHDCSPLTGGCLYPMDCIQFHDRCGSCQRCPQLHNWPLATNIDLTGAMQAYKRVTAREGNVHPIAPSNWMADQAVAARMFPKRPRVMPYAVDTELFRPMIRETAREKLGLPRDRFIILLSAGHLADPRKGTSYAIEALRRCERPVEVIAVGANDSSILGGMEGLSVHPAGYVRDKLLLATYYAAADVYLFPSLADNLPCSIMEAMSCGTPVVGFDSGGIGDMVEHEVNGWLATPYDTQGLVAGLQTTYDRPELLNQWSIHGREKMVRHFTPEAFIRNHLELYYELLDRQQLTVGNAHRQQAA